MSRVYRKVYLGFKTNIFKCESCMDLANETKLSWDDVIIPGHGSPGRWEEAPLEKCDVCLNLIEKGERYDEG